MDQRDGKMLTLTSRRWEIVGRRAVEVMDARAFLLTASYFLKFPLEEMMQSALEAIALSYRSVVIMDTNLLSQELCQYLVKNFKEITCRSFRQVR